MLIAALKPSAVLAINPLTRLVYRAFSRTALAVCPEVKAICELKIYRILHCYHVFSVFALLRRSGRLKRSDNWRNEWPKTRWEKVWIAIKIGPKLKTFVSFSSFSSSDLIVGCYWVPPTRESSAFPSDCVQFSIQFYCRH